MPDTGIDFVMEGRVETPELRGALAEALGVHDVEIVRAVPRMKGDQAAYAVVREVGGDFGTHVSLDPRGDLETVRAVSRALGMRAITPDDDSDNPYAMVLVRPDGRTERVALQAEALDERGEYRLL
jgi:hypothetical protein